MNERTNKEAMENYPNLQAALEIQAVKEHEAARILQKSVQSLRNERHLGRGCAYCKIGRNVRYLLSDIENYLMQNRIEPRS
jgi:hypothetical protein